MHKSLRKIQKTEQITRDFCCIFYRFVDFLTLNTLTQLYLKNLYTFRTNIVSRSYRIIKGLAPTVIRIWLCFGQRSRFSSVFGATFTICFALSALVISFTQNFYFADLKKKECSCLGVQSHVPIRFFSS